MNNSKGRWNRKKEDTKSSAAPSVTPASSNSNLVAHVTAAKDSNSVTHVTASKNSNLVAHHARSALKSEFARVDGATNMDFQNAITGGSIYLPNYFCEINNINIFNELMDNIKKEEKNELIDYSKHMVLTDPSFLPKFNE
eukprot:GHVL01041939.1.p2 GENE.GHVL01041939.1~~GHVL01041939.1.p2  ORF type:complete len:140 (+),score=33.71 GHVL01041939.1:18-437(+)